MRNNKIPILSESKAGTNCKCASRWKLFGNISAKSRKKKEISTNKSADIPIRSLLNMVVLHLNSLDIQLVDVHCSYFQCFSFGEVSYGIQRHFAYLVKEFGCGCIYGNNIG